MNNNYYVYAYFRSNGEIMWIGKGKGDRINWCMYANRRKLNHISNAIRKTLREIGDIPRVKILTDLSEEHAFAIEKLFIRHIGRVPNGPLLNQTDGGDGASGVKISDEQRQDRSKLKKLMWASWTEDKRNEVLDKIHSKLKGRAQTEQHKAKIGNALRGRIFTDEHKQKLRESKKDLPMEFYQSSLAKLHSPESKLKHQEAVKREEYRQKLRAAHKRRGPKRPPEVGRKISESQKARYQRIREERDRNNTSVESDS